MVPEFAERRWVLRQLGYMALGLTDAQCFFMWQGPPGAGKSVTAGVACQVLGTYAAPADVNTFLQEKNGRDAAKASPDLARLAGATRLISVSEPPRGAKLNGNLIMSATGGAPLTARHLNRDLFTFNMKGRLLMEVNSLPIVTDEGMWRRLKLTSWRVALKEHERIGGLAARIADNEAAGVLNTIIDGALSYLTGGLRQPPSISAAHENYRRGSNPFKEWVETYTVLDPTHVCTQKELMMSYCAALEADDLEPMNKVAFGRALDDLQVITTKRQAGTGLKRRKGMRLLNDFERAERSANRPDDITSEVVTDCSSPSRFNESDGDDA